MALTVRYLGRGAVEVAESSPRAPGPGQVEVAPAYTGVCGTDLHLCAGRFDADVSPPVVVGHESAGRITALGEGVTGWTVGDPVTVMPYRTDGGCPPCRAGRSHLCTGLDFFGYHSPGALSERWTVPATSLVRLPEALDLRSAALAEPTAVAVHAVERAALRPSERVVVVGAGPVGLLVALVARHTGADVAIVEPRPVRREVAERYGLTAAATDRSGLERISDGFLQGAGADATFEVSGTAAGLDSAVALLAAGGRTVQVGLHDAPRPVDLMNLYLREIDLLSSRLYRRHHMERAVELISSAAVAVMPLVGDVVPLQEAPWVLAPAGGAAGVKTLVSCQC